MVGTAADGAEAVELATRTRPDVILMDIRMPVMDGLDATAPDPGRPTPATKVLMLTTFDLDEYVFGALRAGASGFLLKDTPPADLLAGDPGGGRRRGVALAERHPATDRGVRPAPPAGRVAAPALDGADRARGRGADAGRPRASPTPRSRQRLYVSPATAKTHVARLLMKLHARDRAQLIIVAYESGLVTPQTPAA